MRDKYAEQKFGADAKTRRSNRRWIKKKRMRNLVSMTLILSLQYGCNNEQVPSEVTLRIPDADTRARVETLVENLVASEGNGSANG